VVAVVVVENVLQIMVLDKEKMVVQVVVELVYFLLNPKIRQMVQQVELVIHLQLVLHKDLMVEMVQRCHVKVIT
tara:strand:+ start:14 stop:235 length:222 start_codon:yes stop_codon:yes gene_type:complete